jgi:hypothetical protein
VDDDARVSNTTTGCLAEKRDKKVYIMAKMKCEF